ncbi:MAG: hypothetical protein AB1762_08450, partial [Gemmatimonadota bacterium]
EDWVSRRGARSSRDIAPRAQRRHPATSRLLGRGASLGIGEPVDGEDARLAARRSFVAMGFLPSGSRVMRLCRQAPIK